MISQKKEKAVIEMLEKQKYSLRKISMTTGVSWGTVKALKDRSQKIRSRANLPMVMRRKAKPRICPKCNANVAIWPCIKCNPDHFVNHIELRPNIYKDMSTIREAKKQLPALLCLANDLQEFTTLNEYHHPLLTSLTNRARAIFNTILKNGRSNDEA